ncbi:uncharacterized protein LOC120331636 isoform X2 [Styela clava]
MHKSIIILLFGVALLCPHFTFAADGEAEDDASVAVEAEGAEGEESESTESTEKPNEEGQKELTLEDIQLWSSIDLDKDGKLTVSEFDRFVRSPSSAAFVAQMKSEKAIKAWADNVGIDVAKAKQAMALGAQSQAARIRAANIQQIQRQRAIQQHQYRSRVNQQSRVNNYFANLGRQYYRAAVSRGGRRDEL